MSSLDTLIQKLAGAPSSVSASNDTVGEKPVVESVELIDPVYVEKLASAVDFIIDSWAGGEEEVSPSDTEVEAPPKVKSATVSKASEPAANTVSEISSLLREKLQDRLVTKKAEAEEQEDKDNKDVAEAILGKLLQLKSKADIESDSNEETQNVGAVDEDTAALESGFASAEEDNVYSDEESESNDADGEAAVKAASADQSLADVLNAALGTDEQSVESDSNESAKTAGVRGSEGSTKTRKAATQVLKTKLMAKVGEEAQL